MAEKIHIPAIRFKGFNGNWEISNWTETVDISTNMVDPRDGKYDELFHIGPGNIESFTGRIYDNVLKVKDSNLISGKFHFKKGDVIYGKINPQLAKYTIAPFDGLASADAYVLNKKNGVVQNFLYLILQSTSFYKYSVSVSSRTGMPKINREELGVFNYFAPSENEQAQIGSYFQNLDKLISLHQTKVNKLVNLKKAMLEKMFPKNGAEVPEIRFKGFEGDWEEKRLSEDVADIVGGGTPSSFESSYWNGNIDWYSPTEIGTEVFANGSVKKITELGLKNSSAKLLPANKTILFTSRAGIGDMAILKRIGATNQGFQSLVLKDGYDTYFIYSMGVLIKDFAIRYSSGSTFLEISGKMLGKMVLRMPSITEQEKIGTFFQSLDKLISLQISELDKLNRLKKACLEKMFV